MISCFNIFNGEVVFKSIFVWVIFRLCLGHFWFVWVILRVCLRHFCFIWGVKRTIPCCCHKLVKYDTKVSYFYEKAYVIRIKDAFLSSFFAEFGIDLSIVDDFGIYASKLGKVFSGIFLRHTIKKLAEFICHKENFSNFVLGEL